MARLSAYSANITGSDAYWFQRRYELEATFEQKQPATAFFTFSYANNQWPDLQRILPGKPAMNPKERYKKVLENPHLVDWFFGFRLEQFIKIIFGELMGYDWVWYRFEWQMRDAIHAHGAIRFSNDPGLIDLTKKVYAGRLAEQRIKSSKTEATEGMLEVIKIGKEADLQVCSYVDSLLTAVNTRLDMLNDPRVPNPHPCSVDFLDVQDHGYSDDYAQIVNCCQRHICAPSGYCLSKKTGGCRFGFPIAKQDKTEIVFVESGSRVKAEIVIKRNDEFLNVHNPIMCQGWRANVDLQVIVDKEAAINYMVKYASKGEKAGRNLVHLYKSTFDNATSADNPASRLRSLMLRTIATQRDLGQCEITRLLLSNKLHHSTFTYVTVSLDIDSVQLGPGGKVVQSLLGFYADRFKNTTFTSCVANGLTISNFNQFAQHFKIYKGQLHYNSAASHTVVVTRPVIRFNPANKENHMKFCFYQLIKYQEWSSANVAEMANQETAVQRWEQFIKSAPDKMLDTIE